MKMYNQEFKDKRKEYNEINRVEILEKKRLYRIKNKEEIAVYDKNITMKRVITLTKVVM